MLCYFSFFSFIFVLDTPRAALFLFPLVCLHLTSRLEIVVDWHYQSILS